MPNRPIHKTTKGEKMKKIIFTILLLFSSLNADTILGGLINTANTKASSWTSPVTKEHYYYSGSYEFTFNNQTNYAPWFNASPPKVSIGCAGISIKGGFLSLLGLDEIKEQISNSGAQLAWGVMLGLVYSMPGVSDVFMKLQKWARAIQKLLQNSCKIGQAFGDKYLKNQIDFDLANTDAGKYLKNTMQGLSGSLDKAANWVDTINTCLSNGNTDILDDCKAKANKTKTKQAKQIAKKAGESIINNLINQRITPSNSSIDNNIYTGSLDELFTSNKVGSKTLPTLNDDLKNTIKLNLLFFGDKALSAQDSINLLKNTNCEGNLNPDKTCSPQLNTDRVKSSFTNILDETQLDTAPIPPALSPVQSAQALLYGFTSKTGSNCSDTHQCTFPNYITMFVNISNDKKPMQFFTLTSAKTTGDISVTWTGAIQESVEKIRAYVKNKSGINPTIPVVGETTPVTNEESIIPLLVPGIGKYIDIISNIEKKNKKETMFTSSLKEMLAKYNAYLFAKYLISMEEARILNGQGDTSATTSGSTDEQINTLKETKAEIQKILDGILKENNYFKDIADIFKEIEVNYKKDITKNF